MKSLANSFKYAICGVKTALDERNMRIHLCFAFYVVLGGVFAGISKTQWALILICIAVVLAAECFNSALEALCDEVTEERRAGIKRAKDMAAGAVLICALIAAVVGGTIFFNTEKISRAWEYALRYPVISIPALLCLPLWLYYIFKTKQKEK